MNYIVALIASASTIFGVLVAFKYFFIVDLAIDNNIFKILYQLLKDSSKRIVLEEEFLLENRHPQKYRVLIWSEKYPPFYLCKKEETETLWTKKSVNEIKVLRWHLKRMNKFLKEILNTDSNNDQGVRVEIALPHYTDNIGIIRKSYLPVMRIELWEDIAKEVEEVAQGKRDRTSCILYSKPGNGKTSFIRYLALKYNLPIRIFTFSPEYTSIDIMRMFAQVKEKSIVLLEDFDNYFNGRQCIIGESANGGNNLNIKFTFDSILNGLDGAYNDHKNVVFIMTVNDFSKVDKSLSERPSRFKYIREFLGPDQEQKQKFIGEWKVGDISWDQLFVLKEFKEAGVSEEEAKNKINLLAK